MRYIEVKRQVLVAQLISPDDKDLPALDNAKALLRALFLYTNATVKMDTCVLKKDRGEWVENRGRDSENLERESVGSEEIP